MYHDLSIMQAPVNERNNKLVKVYICMFVCANDAAPSNPTTQGRDVADVHEQSNVCSVCMCSSVRRMTYVFSMMFSISLDSGCVGRVG